MASPPAGTFLRSLQLLILFVGSFCAVQINGDNGGDGGGAVELVSTVAEQREFDFFVLPLQWAPTYCNNTEKCCRANACCRGSDSPTGFIINGLWPDYNDGSYPSCCTGPPFDKKQISTLYGDLNKYWPSLTCDKLSTCNNKTGTLWAYEWEVHGTCASSVLKDEYDYFWTALNLYFNYNVADVLSEAGYLPSNTEKYPKDGIISAIQNAFNTTPQVICKKSALQQVRLCFNKDFTSRECVKQSSCPKKVSLPAYTSTEQPEFDFFVLALQWPPTYCNKTDKCCPTNGCCRGSDSPTVFTIRGLWPDYNDGSYPSCCSGPASDEKKISPLYGALNEYWPSLTCSELSTCNNKTGTLWAYEWEKHGTCASSVTNDEHNFFLTALNLYLKYNVTDVLSQAGYLPSNTEKYPKSGIISAIQNAFNTTPQVICNKGALQQVRLCYNKDFTFRPCVKQSSCPKKVSLPTYASMELNNAATADSLFSGRESF